MSLVKKLNPGGTIDVASLNNEISSVLGTKSLNSKHEQLIRDELVKIRDADLAGTINISNDSVAGTYTVKGSDPSHFAGSPDAIKTNPFTGHLKIKNNEDAVSAAMQIYLEAKQRIQGSSTTTPIKQKVGIIDFNSYMTDKAYGTSEGYASDFESIQDDELRKKEVFNQAKQYLSGYLADVDKNKDWADYADLDKVKAVQQAVDANDWEGFKKSSHLLGWNPSAFLLQDSDREKIKAHETAVKTEAEAKVTEANNAALKTDLVSKGYTPAMADQLITAKYKLGSFKTPQGLSTNPDLVNEYLTKKHAYVFDSPTGSQSIFNTDGTVYNESGSTFDRFNPLYGLAWEHDANYNFTPKASAWKQTDLGDRVGLEGIAPGFENYSIEGIGEGTPDSRDYLNHIVLKKGTSEIHLKKGSDGKYRSEEGVVYPGINITGYGQEKETPYSASSDFPEFYNNSLKVTHYNPTDFISLQRAYNTGYDRNADIPTAMRLNAALGTPGVIPDVTSQDKLLRNNIIQLLHKFSKKLKGIPAEATPKVAEKKEGGILIAQAGNALKERREWLKQQPNPASTKPTAAVVDHGDITGTWAGQDTTDNVLDTISIAGAAGSFVPVYGAIGALTTLGADAIKDLRDGHVDNWGTHALNAGFVALSAIGMGGLKSLAIGAKLANTFKGAGEVAEIGSKAAQYATKMGITAKDGEALSKVVKLAEKVGAKTPEQLIQKVAQISAMTPKAETAVKFGDHVKVLNEGLAVLTELAKGPLPVFGNVGLGQASKIAGKVASKIGSTVTGQVGKAVVKGAVMLPGAMSIAKVAPAVLKGDIEYTNPNDWKNIALAGSMGAYSVNSFRGARAFERQTLKTAAGENRTIVNLGNNDQVILKKTMVPPEVQTKSAFSKTNNKFLTKDETVLKRNEEALEKYKNDIIAEAKNGAVKKDGTPLSADELKSFEDQVKTLKREAFIPERSSTKGSQRLGDAATPTTRGRVIDNRDFRLAKKYAERHWIPEASVMKETRVTTPEQKALQDVMKNTPVSKNSTLLNKELGKKVSEIKQTLKDTQGKYPINKKTLPAMKKKAKLYTDKYKTIYKREGGVLKAQQGIYVPPIADPFTNQYSPIVQETAVFGNAKQPGKLDSNPIGYSAYSQNKYWNSEQNYRNNWIPLVKQAINDPIKLNMLIQKMGNYQGQDAKDAVALINNAKTFQEKRDLIERLGTDGQIGPYHYLLQGMLDPQGSTTTNSPTNTPTSTPLGPNASTGSATNPTASVNGVINPPTATKTPFNWKNLITPINDAAMLAGTFGSIGRSNRIYGRAIVDGMYREGNMPHIYGRIDKPYSLKADALAGKTRSQAARIGLSTDLNTSINTRLKGEEIANDLEMKGQTADIVRKDQLEGQQRESNFKIDEYNVGVENRNKARTAEAMKNIHLNNANTEQARANAATTGIHTADRDFKILQGQMEQDKTWNMMNDPALKSEIETHNKLAGEETYNAEKAKYEAKKLANPKMILPATFEESPDYQNWQKLVKTSSENLKRRMEPLRYQQGKTQFYQNSQYIKKGGSISVQDQIAIDNNRENIRYNSRRKLKNTEMFYKTILHNNEMLLRSLNKIFK